MHALAVDRGSDFSLCCMFRLWCYCAQRGKWSWPLFPAMLAGMCDFGGQPEPFFCELTKLGFIVPDSNDSWRVLKPDDLMQEGNG
jgi:hypothetical protein